MANLEFANFVSSLGVLLWCAAASICLFAAMTLRNVTPRDTFWFLLSSALLSTYLLFDDLFQFHEDLASRYLGLNEKVATAALLIAISTYLIAFRRIILRTNFSFLIVSARILRDFCCHRHVVVSGVLF